MANEIIKGAGSHHIALMASDLDRSLAFYKALGFTEVARWGDETKTIVMLDIGDGSRIELFSNGGDEYSVSGKWAHFAVRVDNVDEAFDIAVKAGGVPKTYPKIVPLNSTPRKMSINIAFVKGPDGEELEFFREIR